MIVDSASPPKTVMESELPPLSVDTMSQVGSLFHILTVSFFLGRMEGEAASSHNSFIYFILYAQNTRNFSYMEPANKLP
jgi:hypothetical protein